MNAILTLVLLVCLTPGAILPSHVTDQLIAPPICNPEKGPDGDSESDDAPSMAATPSLYSATRPATCQMTRSEIRAISTRTECWPATRALSEAVSRPVPEVRLMFRRVMEADDCHAHESRFTSPQINPQAPPL